MCAAFNATQNTDWDSGVRPSLSAGKATPISIELERGTLFGWYHPPRCRSPAHQAVLLFNPVGWEGLACYRAYRHWAERLAAVGFPVLRFDYLGTGDSADGDAHEPKVASWLASARAAAAELRSRSGRDALVLAGVHFGATLAALASEVVGGVESLVLLGPLVRGRDYVRQARAYALLNAANDSPGSPADGDAGVEVAGFHVNPATLAEMEAIDLRTLTVRGARSLVLSRDETSREDELVAAWQARGVAAELRRIRGYHELVQKPSRSLTPGAIFQAAEDFLLTGLPAPSPGRAPAREARPAVRESARRYRESALSFGANGRLFGVLTEPVRAEEASSERPVLVILPTSSHHRVGPNRMYVPLARELAERGFTSFRIDLTGGGDSPASSSVRDGQAYAEEFVADARAAMDHLAESVGSKRFVLLGLCSGALLAFQTTSVDPRVVGEVLVSQQVWNLSDVPSDTRFERVKQRATASLTHAVRRTGLAFDTGRVDVGASLRDALGRGVEVLLIYGAQDPGLARFRAEAARELAHLTVSPRFALALLDGVDRTFTALRSQRLFHGVVMDYMLRRFAREGVRPCASGG